MGTTTVEPMTGQTAGSTIECAPTCNIMFPQYRSIAAFGARARVTQRYKTPGTFLRPSRGACDFQFARGLRGRSISQAPPASVGRHEPALRKPRVRLVEKCVRIGQRLRIIQPRRQRSLE